VPVKKLNLAVKKKAPAQNGDNGGAKTYKGYCVKCKEKGVELKDAVVETMKNGRKMAKGKHDKCGTTVCCILGKDG
jgi:hypothetical protein